MQDFTTLQEAQEAATRLAAFAYSAHPETCCAFEVVQIGVRSPTYRTQVFGMSALYKKPQKIVFVAPIPRPAQ